jgi:error-prone DNA polymerase
MTEVYSELHCHSNFSFLDGASHPEDLVDQAAHLGLGALALTDHDGLPAAVRFAEAARGLGVRTIFGAELSLEPAALAAPQPAGRDQADARPGSADPRSGHLLVLARGPEGYAKLSRFISEAHLRSGEKSRPRYAHDGLTGLEAAAAALRGQVLVLTGCRKGHVPAALLAPGAEGGRDAACGELRRLVALFGADSIAVELTDHAHPGDDERNEALAELAAASGLPAVATNNVHYATPASRRMAGVLAAIRARRSLSEIDGWLPATGAAHLRSPEEMAERFAGYPGAVRAAADLGAELAFDLDLVAPGLPDFDLPDGMSAMEQLRQLTAEGALRRYGTREEHPKAHQQLDRELRLIAELGFAGYFLIVHDIVRFCVENDIYCQGRGSAANSAVCYALGITRVDAVRWELLFERFLSPERDGPPDIDVDLESRRREEVIQYVYRRYGREHAAQVANVITYRRRSAIRDVARAFGYSPGQQDAWSKLLDRDQTEPPDIPPEVIEYAEKLRGFPRHLGIHSAGMVICDRPVIEVCPVEPARMPGRTVLQWDKDDCAAAGLVKFDLLGLGMLSALRYAVDLVDPALDLGKLDLEDPEVYDMLCRADSVGVFQVESRAQMTTLPRLRPRTFYDLVVEVALIRPGPIQGGAVHPYLRRRAGRETGPRHPRLENALGKTLGVPLFQEQLMRIAIDAAGFTPAEADELRRAMSAKRSRERMARLRDRLYSGLATNGIEGKLADELYEKLAAFAGYGFPESHAMSFAYLVFASAWFKRYHPAAFCAALLNAQPMGFYSPQSLVDDARRHGVLVLRPDLNASGAGATLEQPGASDRPRRAGPGNPGRGDCPANGPKAPPAGWGSGGPVLRLGLRSVRSLSPALAERIVAERAASGPYQSLPDLVRRVGLSVAHLEALATAGAFVGFGLTRRQALWAAGPAAQETSGRLPGTTPGLAAPMLPGMDRIEVLRADLWATGISPDAHPVQFAREHLDRIGALPVTRLPLVESGRRIWVGGIITHRQRPETAGGTTFLSLEDETGILNVTCSVGLWRRYRRTALTANALIIRGMLENAEGVVNLRADHLTPLAMPVRSSSRDFH